MNTDLYSLPKDILVKLVTTIREEVVKEVTSKYEEKFNFIKESIHMDECVFPDCESFRVITNKNTLNNFKCLGLSSCRECNKNYCDKHLTHNFYCEDCKEKFVYCNEENCEKMWTSDKGLNKEYRLCLFCENPYCNDHIEETEGEWFCKHCFE